MAFDKYKYDTEYIKNNLKRVALSVRKEYFSDVLSKIPELTGQSINGFIKDAIREKIERDGLDLPDVKA